MSATYDVIILGSGPAGATAALYASRAGLKPLVLHGGMPGGQLAGTVELENFPGFRGTGPELVEFIEQQATKHGAEFRYEVARDVFFSSSSKKILTDCDIYQAKAVIIATGASARFLGLENETRLRGNGVCVSATSEGPLFKGKRVVVVGGGDAACGEALTLLKMCSSVKMVYRGSELKRASLPMRKRVEESSIEVIWDSVIDDVLGDERVAGVKVKNLKTGQITDIECDGLFVSIGRSPATEVFRGKLELDDAGYIKTFDGPTTSVSGVFACGDCTDKSFGQAITSAAAGCQAALLAERYFGTNSPPATETTKSSKCCNIM